jgi:serine/threonine protein kinase
MNPAQAIDDRAGQAGAQSPAGRALPRGTRLREYELADVIGQAGFGIVYRAWDTTLQRGVAVKEFLPFSIAIRPTARPRSPSPRNATEDTYKASLKSFVAEARLLARFDHASLVKVYRFWEENGTAYMVMPFYEGQTLEGALAELDHVPGEAELRAWLKPVLNAVSLLHDGGVWHQNIGPDNILLTPVGPVLFGFGSAQQTIAALEHTPAAALKPGFAAIEQYGNAAETKRGPWTDLYALAAVIYAAITGSAPAAAADRLAQDPDPVRPLSIVAAGLYGERFLAAIDAAMAVEPERRPQDHRQFRALMGDIDSPEPLELAPHPRPDARALRRRRGPA